MQIGHLSKLNCAHSPLILRILSSKSVQFTLTTVQVPNLALTHTKRITVYRIHPPLTLHKNYLTSRYVRLSSLNLPQPTWANITTFNSLSSTLPISFLSGPPRPLPLILIIRTKHNIQINRLSQLKANVTNIKKSVQTKQQFSLGKCSTIVKV